MKRRLSLRVLLTILVLLVALEIVGPAQAPENPEFLRAFGTMGSAESQLNAPEGVSVSADGEIYVADTNNHRVQVFSLEGEYLRSWGSFCSLDEIENCESDNGHGQFNFPEGIVANSVSQRVYVSDSSNDRIQVFDLEGNFVNAFGASGDAEGEFTLPIGLELDDDDNLYVADLLNHRIQVFDAEGTFIRAWGSRGDGLGELSFPVDVAIFEDNVYVAENANNRIQQFDTEGLGIRLIGSKCELAIGEGCETQTGDGQFLRPFSVATDSVGNIYVVDQSNHRIQILTGDGTFISQFGSSCTLFGNDEIEPGVGCQAERENGEGQFFFPKGIDVDHEGQIIIADSDNHRIQMFN